MPRKNEVTRIRPADENHQVLTVVSKDKSTDDYQRRPCRTCPWRVDAVGEFPAEAFRHSAETAYDMSATTFACHTAGHEDPKTCAGFLLSSGAEHNFAVRMARMKRRGIEQVDADGIELFDSYRDMAVANGVDPDEPVLGPCR